MIVLDTDILSIIQRRKGAAYERLVERLDAAQPEPISVAIVSFEEQMRGWMSFLAKSKRMQDQITAYARLHALLLDFQNRPVLDFDENVAVEYQRLVKARIRIGTMDLKIAATVVALGGILISRNLSDFRKVPDLRVEDWTT